jgi:hypothetical protein
MRGPLRAISPDATPEQVAAIVAALSVLTASESGTDPTGDDLRAWVWAARLRSRRAGLQRGPWRMAGRIPRRDGS